VNGEHVRAFFWLRWRLRVNQLKRGGMANVVLLGILAAGAVLLAGSLFIGAFLAGLFLLPKASPAALLYTWDGVVVVFLFFWATGLLADLQRSESLSLDKFLHLPVSLSGAFLVNYLSSLFSINLLFFVPAALGLSLGLVLGRGPAMLLLLPLLGAFLLMVTALTYQFQGWLAALMANKRRRRTVIVVATMVLVLLAQLPNLLNVTQPWRKRQHEMARRLSAKQAELIKAHAAGKMSAREYQRRSKEVLEKHNAETEELNRQVAERAERTAAVLNLVLPPGWLPLGARGLAEGNVVPALLGTLGMGLIGLASLWRAYRTTVRLYTGQLGEGARKPAAPPPPVKGARPSVRLLEWRVPWLSEHASAIALAGFRSLMRAPEVKMILLGPVILVVVFGSLMLTRPGEMPAGVRPLLPFGAMGMILLGMVQLAGNQFGFDRGGFRAFVLCPARREDILLGKNLASAPLALGLGLAMTLVLEVVYPLRWDHFLGALPQMVSMYLLFCLLANWLSILAPLPVAAGTLKPTSMKGLPILLHLGFVFVLPWALGLTLVPLGVEALLGVLEVGEGLPVFLVLSVLECAGVGGVYWLVVRWQGRLLQGRELKVLEVVTSAPE
jgi:hypothetical protein